MQDGNGGAGRHTYRVRAEEVRLRDHEFLLIDAILPIRLQDEIGSEAVVENSPASAQDEFGLRASDSPSDA